MVSKANRHLKCSHLASYCNHSSTSETAYPSTILPAPPMMQFVYDVDDIHRTFLSLCLWCECLCGTCLSCSCGKQDTVTHHLELQSFLISNSWQFAVKWEVLIECEGGPIRSRSRPSSLAPGHVATC